MKIVTHILAFIIGTLSGLYLIAPTSSKYELAISGDRTNVKNTTIYMDQVTESLRPSTRSNNQQEATKEPTSAPSDDKLTKLRKIENLIKQSLLIEAAEKLQTFQEDAPYSTYSMYLSAQIKHQSGDVSGAIIQLYEMLEYRPEEPLHNKAKILLSVLITRYLDQLTANNDSAKLLEFFRLLSANEPERADYRYHLSRQLFMMDFFQESINQAQHIEDDRTWGERANQLKIKAERQLELITAYPGSIPLQRAGGHFYTHALLNKIIPLRMMLDTGASLSTISPDLVKKHHLITDTAQIQLITASGKIKASLVSDQKLSLGNYEVDGLKLTVVQLHDGLDTDGLLGMDFLSQFDFVIDQEKTILYLKPRSL